MRLQGGSYIPGVSNVMAGVGLAKDVHGSMQDIGDIKQGLGKFAGRLGLAGKFGGALGGAALKHFGGKKIASLLAKTAFGSTPLGMIAGVAAPMLLERFGKFGGGEAMKVLAKKFGLAKAPESVAGGKYGLHKDAYKSLSEQPGKIESELTGESFGKQAGSLSINEVLRNLPEGILGEAGEQIGKWQAGRTGVTGHEGTGIGNLFKMDMTGDRTPFGGAGNTFAPGYGGFGLDMTGQQDGGYIPQYQIGGALGKAFGLSRPSLETGSRVSDAGKWISEYKPGQTKGWMSAVDELAGDTDVRKKALAELGGMEHAESARESAREAEDIYQQSLGDMDRGNLKSLLGLTEEAVKTSKYGPDKGTGVRELSGPFEGGYYYDDKGLVDVPRQMQRPKYQQEELEPLGGLSGEELAPESDKERFMWGRMPKDVGIMDKYWEMAQENPYEDIVSGLEYGTRQPEQSLMDRLLGRGGEQLPEGSGKRLRKLMGDEAYFSEGMQMGGMAPGGVSNPLPYQQGGYMPRYNIGGSVTQQPMAYQLGGLLKYKRSPFG